MTLPYRHPSWTVWTPNASPPGMRPEEDSALPAWSPTYLLHGQLLEDRVVLVQAQFPEPVEDPVLLLGLRGLQTGGHQDGGRGVHLGPVGQGGACTPRVGAVGQGGRTGRVLHVVLGAALRGGDAGHAAHRPMGTAERWSSQDRSLHHTRVGSGQLPRAGLHPRPCPLPAPEPFRAPELWVGVPRYTDVHPCVQVHLRDEPASRHVCTSVCEYVWVCHHRASGGAARFL